MKPSISPSEDQLREIAKNQAAWYERPIVDGVRTGPLVVYAGKDSQDRNFVGDVYFNFARIEPDPDALRAFAQAAFRKLVSNELFHSFDTILGIPEGGRTLAQDLNIYLNRPFKYPTKKPRPIEGGKKQEYDWDMSRFGFEKGERVAVVEDVFNNFQNTDTTLEMIAKTGAIPVLLIGAFNRSPIYDTAYVPKTGIFAGTEIPIIASIRQACDEFEQDDPVVAADIAAGNIEYDVKNNWDRLRAAMQIAA